MWQIDLRMAPEEKVRQQMDAILSRYSWTVQCKSQMNLHAAESTTLRQLTAQKRIVAEVERRMSVVEELSALVTANLLRATRLRQSILQPAFVGELSTR
jgi:hypothetical protein